WLVPLVPSRTSQGDRQRDAREPRDEGIQTSPTNCIAGVVRQAVPATSAFATGSIVFASSNGLSRPFAVSTRTTPAQSESCGGWGAGRERESPMRALFRIVRRVGLFALAGLVLATSAAGQTGLATVTGLVADSSGAAVPGVTVTATNQATNIAYTGVTNQAGNYVIT